MEVWLIFRASRPVNFIKQHVKLVASWIEIISAHPCLLNCWTSRNTQSLNSLRKYESVSNVRYYSDLGNW
jgi:hypothetical protein